MGFSSNQPVAATGFSRRGGLASAPAQDRDPSEFYANVGSWLVDSNGDAIINEETGKPVFVSLGGFGLDNLKISNGVSAMAQHRQSDYAEIMTLATSLQPGTAAYLQDVVVEVRRAGQAQPMLSPQAAGRAPRFKIAV